MAAFRSIRVSSISKSKEKAPGRQVEKQQPIPLLGEALFGQKPAMGISTSNLNPFSAQATSMIKRGSKSSSPFMQKPGMTSSAIPGDLPVSFAEKVRVSSPPQEMQTLPFEPWPSDPAFPPYPSFFLDAEFENLDEELPSLIPLPQVSLDDAEGPQAKGRKEDTEIFESTLDQTFQQFADRLSQNPLQVLRYEFRGQPLLYSKTDAIGRRLNSPQGHADRGTPLANQVTVLRLPRCGNCGAARTFELQLTPHMITELEEDDEDLDGMEWGAMILGVCESDCQAREVVEGKVGYLEEWVGVQWEEMRR